MSVVHLPTCWNIAREPRLLKGYVESHGRRVQDHGTKNLFSVYLESGHSLMPCFCVP